LATPQYAVGLSPAQPAAHHSEVAPEDQRSAAAALATHAPRHIVLVAWASIRAAARPAFPIGGDPPCPILLS